MRLPAWENSIVGYKALSEDSVTRQAHAAHHLIGVASTLYRHRQILVEPFQAAGGLQETRGDYC